ncbi:hypothetical protein BDF22DRAFT_718242 [Syncephalis plumigaleata]|nr:hypothetical protein BDF22DRAFT_718242 [Syncephalis plumigaleata]
MLHKRLTGRFRPIVTAIEGILKGGEWNTVIDKVEEILTSYGEHERPGNLCGELIRLETKMDRHLKNFSKRFSIKEALGLFLFGHYHLGKSSIEFEHTDAWLVEAAFGRIKFLEGVPKTVLDEPFVLKATINYFQVKDPLLISSLQRAMQLADSPSAQGSMWELVMPSIFVETFNNPVTRNLNFWSLSTTLPDQLVGNVTIVGYKEDKRLTMPYPELTIHQFMKAHAENGSKQGDESMPPFYFPDPQVTGPDIMFFVKINNNIYPCFVQLKLRKTLSGSNAKAALETVSSKTIQEKMKTEHEKQKKTSASSDQQQPQLQDYCPNGKYISMVIVYPAKVTNFQAIQPDPKLELEGLERVSINIDGSNFSKIFPSGHVKFLNILKEYKRRSEDQLPQQSKRSKTDHDS